MTSNKIKAIKLKDCSFFVDFKTSKKILEVVRTKQFNVYDADDNPNANGDENLNGVAIEEIEADEVIEESELGSAKLSSKILSKSSRSSKRKKTNPFYKLVKK